DRRLPRPPRQARSGSAGRDAARTRGWCRRRATRRRRAAPAGSWPIAQRQARYEPRGLPLRSQHPLVEPDAADEPGVHVGPLDLAHAFAQLLGVAGEEAGAVVDAETGEVREDARQACPDGLRGDPALEDRLVVEDHAVAGG